MKRLVLVNRKGIIQQIGCYLEKRLSESQKEELKIILQALPEKQGMQVRKWNGRLLSSYISERYGISLQIRSCQLLLHELTVNT